MKSRPRMLVCYLCGREYGTASLPIHIPQCEKRWIDEEALKPPNQRRQVPQPPSSLPSSSSVLSAQDVLAFNSEMMHQYSTESLERCTVCGRSFNSQAFAKHQELCTEAHPFRPAGTSLGPQALSKNLAPVKVSTHQQAAHSQAQAVDKPKGGMQAGKPAVCSPGKAALRTSCTSAELPPEVRAMAEEVCSPAGASAVTALIAYLKEQRVTSIADMQHLELDWMRTSLEPKGITAMLLNKFLITARQQASASV